MLSLYFHHTDQENAKKINECQMITQSIVFGEDDAILGKGVYLTKLGPNHSKQNLSRNNFTDRSLWERKIDEGQLLIAVKLPEAKVKAVNIDRDIYFYTGDLSFSDAEYVELFIKDGNGMMKYEPFTLNPYKI
jgi:hypothetical protein